MSKAKAGQDQPVEIPDVLPILPLRNSVLFPGSIIPIDVGRRKSVRLVEDAIAKERPVIGILTQKDARTEDPASGDLYLVGCAARILKVIKLAKDNFSVILQGVSRFEVTGFDGAEPFLSAKVRAVPDPTTSDVELDALVMNLKDIAKRVVKLMDAVPKEAGALVDSVTEPGHLADLITANLELEVGEKQDVLETFDIKTRTRKVLQFLSRQLEVLKVRERINTQVQEEMGRNQREYVLRQQLKAIKEELGELDDGGGDLDEFGEKILKAKMPEEAEKAAKKQLDRLKGMQPSSAEYTVTRTYLEWLVELPWSISTDDHIDLKEVRRCLDEDHYDLDKVKKRIVEYMAVRKLKDDKKGPILCLAGPPGVGKTSLGKLGGARDRPQVRAHLARRRARRGRDPRPPSHLRRLAARPHHPGHQEGRHQQPGVRPRRDRQARPRLPRRSVGALLEVLDPEQNSTFSDHYLEVPFDLSKVMFIATANQLDPIPPGAARPPRDHRAAGLHPAGEAGRSPGRFLVPKQLEEHGLGGGGATGKAARSPTTRCSRSIDSYTREAGVRNLEREIGSVCRGIAVKVAEGDAKDLEITVDRADGPRLPRARRSSCPRSPSAPAEPGVATGLAWTPVGGDIMFIEATQMPGKGG
jgi:ATP-dependent Lon protease